MFIVCFILGAWIIVSCVIVHLHFLCMCGMWWLRPCYSVSFVFFFRSNPSSGLCVCVCVVSWRCCCCLRPPSLSLDIVLLSKVVGKEFSSLSFYVKSKFSFLFGFWLRPFLPQSFIRSHSRVVLWHCKRRCEIENKMWLWAGLHSSSWQFLRAIESCEHAHFQGHWVACMCVFRSKKRKRQTKRMNVCSGLLLFILAKRFGCSQPRISKRTKSKENALLVFHLKMSHAHVMWLSAEIYVTKSFCCVHYSSDLEFVELRFCGSFWSS